MNLQIHIQVTEISMNLQIHLQVTEVSMNLQIDTLSGYRRPHESTNRYTSR